LCFEDEDFPSSAGQGRCRRQAVGPAPITTASIGSRLPAYSPQRHRDLARPSPNE
jgi:hypothetical protein